MTPTKNAARRKGKRHMVFRSQPQYAPLEHKPAQYSLLVADGEGAQAILDFAKKLPKDFWQNAQLIYLKRDQGDAHVDALEALGAASFYAGPDYNTASQRIVKVLGDAKMGTQIYLAGSEGVMGQVLRDAMNAGFSHEPIQMEHRGPASRRMQCVHCKGITEDVTTDPFECAHCKQMLFVRDHYSRRLAAYQAVRVDAEDHGNIPDVVEL